MILCSGVTIELPTVDGGSTLGNRDGTIELCDVAAGRKLATIKGHKGRILSLAHSRDGKILATGGSDCTLKIWDSTTLGEVTTLKAFTPSDNVWSAIFSPDKRIWATVGNDVVKLWDVATGRELNTVKVHDPRIKALEFTREGKRLVTLSDDGNVKLWDVVTGRELNTLKGHGGLRSVSFSPDGKTLATGSTDGTAILWRAATEGEVTARRN
jgi:WD40 repeat protein